ncbi:hypothetical protein CTI12_AA146670 [Artemisia annua]|uniref:Uncharacterized protein n=1 Tax=Artemisia annua TaxID=35608 RepID=A0A2U1PIM9_ARTAN|nr:hypothetical protein CTI12_AA146670 [Artemisia annua]
MGSLGTHFTSFMFLFPLGIHRLVSSFSIYINNNNSPSNYRSKTWFFSNSPTFKNLDFFAYIIALPIASFSNFFLFLAFSGHPVYKFSFMQQSLVVLLFWVVLVFVGVKEFFDPIAMPEHFLFVFAGVAFLVEYLMNGKGVVGLAELEYSFLGGLTLVCAFACFYLSIRPSAFFADFLLSGGIVLKGIVLKGTWVLQVGLSLYSDEFAFKGCGKVVIVRGEGSADVNCVLDEDKLRGVALMNLLFVGHSIVVLILCFVIMGLLNRNKVGLSFYSDAYTFKGCGKVVIAPGQGNADVKCDLDEDKIRVWNDMVNVPFSLEVIHALQLHNTMMVAGGRGFWRASVCYCRKRGIQFEELQSFAYHKDGIDHWFHNKDGQAVTCTQPYKIAVACSSRHHMNHSCIKEHNKSGFGILDVDV